MKRALVIAALSLSTLLAQTPSSTPDDRISDQVRMKLAGDPDVKGGADRRNGS